MAAKNKTDVKEENIITLVFRLLSGQSGIKRETMLNKIFYKELIFLHGYLCAGKPIYNLNKFYLGKMTIFNFFTHRKLILGTYAKLGTCAKLYNNVVINYFY